MDRSIDYGNLMHRAMRGLIRKVLDDVAEGGLPGQHHFFITFDTMHPDVEMADWLSDRYPEESPAHSVYLEDYYIGQYEVTNGHFVTFLNALGRNADLEGEGRVAWC